MEVWNWTPSNFRERLYSHLRWPLKARELSSNFIHFALPSPCVKLCLGALESEEEFSSCSKVRGLWRRGERVLLGLRKPCMVVCPWHTAAWKTIFRGYRGVQCCIHLAVLLFTLHNRNVVARHLTMTTEHTAINTRHELIFSVINIIWTNVIGTCLTISQITSLVSGLFSFVPFTTLVFRVSSGLELTASCFFLPLKNKK